MASVLEQIISIKGKVDPSLRAAVGKANSAVKGMAGKIGKVAKVGAVAGAAVGAGMFLVGKKCADVAIEIDDALTGVRKTVDGTEEQYQALKKAAIDYSKTSSVSAAELLDLQSLGAQLGYNIDELDRFAQVASGLDIATDMDAETAASQMAQFANITKMAHADSERYASTIVALGNNMATTESKVSSMGQRIAAAGTQVGMSQSEILGWSAAMSSLGIEAEAGGTAFSTTISTIDKSVATGGESLNAFAKVAGMSSKKFATAWKKDSTSVMQSLLKGTNGAENLTLALESMGIKGIRQSDVFKRLAGNTELVAEAMKLANDGWDENTALTDEVNNRNSSMSGRLAQLQHKLEAVGEQIGTPLVNGFLALIDAGQPFFDQLDDMGPVFEDLGKTFGDMLVELAPNIKDMAESFGEWLKGDFLTETLPNLVNSFVELLPTVVELMPVLGQLAQDILPILTSAIGIIGPIIQGLTPIIQGVFAVLEPVIASFKQIAEELPGKLQGASEVLSGAFSVVQGAIDGVVGAISGAISGIESFISLCSQGISAAGDFISKSGGVGSSSVGLATGGFTHGISIAGEDPQYPTEAVISFNPAYRAANIQHWQRAGRMLGASDVPVHAFASGGFTNDGSFADESVSLGSVSNTNVVYELGGINFAPQVSVSGDADESSIVDSIRSQWDDMVDMLMASLEQRRAAEYAKL